MYKTLNYKSDFKILECFKDGSKVDNSPFRFTYYTKNKKNTYIASFDGTEYVNCKSDNKGGVIVAFNDHNLGHGELNVEREFFLTDEDFNDGICNLLSVESTGIFLGKGKTKINEGVVVEVFPFYQRGKEGKSAYEIWLSVGNKGTIADFLQDIRGKNLYYEDLTQEDKIEMLNNILEGSIDLSKISEEVKRNFRIYHLGDFTSDTAAYDEAAKYEVYGDTSKNILTFYNSTTGATQIIFQQCTKYNTNDRICTQYMFFNGATRKSYIRTFDLNSRSVLTPWTAIQLYTSYTVENNTVYGITSSEDFNNKLYEKVALFSFPNLVTTNTEQTISSKKTFNADISIKGNSTISSDIDSGELKVLQNNSNNGFIIRTKNNANESIPSLEMLATNRYSSYQYNFPKKNGTIAIAAKLNDTTYYPSINDGVIDLGTSTTVFPQDAGTSVSSTDNKYIYKGSQVNANNASTDVLSDVNITTANNAINIVGKSWGTSNWVTRATLKPATSTAAGIMSAALYNKLQSIPTNVSQLNNDSGYMSEIANSSITETMLSDALKDQINRQLLPGPEGPSGPFKSTVFKRSVTPLTENDKPTGGTYSNPVPSGWSDGIPSGTGAIYSSSATFYSDDSNSGWSIPQLMADSGDFDVCYCLKEQYESYPPNLHPNQNTEEWQNEPSEDAIWMATSKYNVGGTWSDWVISRIKGEKGEKGSDSAAPNLFQNSNFDIYEDGALKYFNIVSRTEKIQGGYDGFYNSMQVKGNHSTYTLPFEIKKDTPYTFSCKAKCTDTGNSSHAYGLLLIVGEGYASKISIYNKNLFSTSQFSDRFDIYFTKSDDFTSQSFTFKYTPAEGDPDTLSNVKVSLYRFVSTIVSEYAQFKIEEGEAVTPWIKSQEDITVKISDTLISYAKHTSGTEKPTEGWSETIPSNIEGYFLWTRTRILYSTGEETDSYSVSRMGIDGKGIKSAVVEYYQSENTIDPEDESITWGTFPKDLEEGWWLYSRTTTTYSDGQTAKSYAVTQIGQGSYYAGLEEYYAISSSKSNPPEGAIEKGEYGADAPLQPGAKWSQERPTATAAEPYIWNFSISRDSKDNAYVTDTICIGNFAKGIVSIVETYAISAYSTAPDGGYPDDISTWSDEHQSMPPTEEKPYQWNKTTTTYNDGEVDTIYHISAVIGPKGSPYTANFLDNTDFSKVDENGVLTYWDKYTGDNEDSLSITVEDKVLNIQAPTSLAHTNLIKQSLGNKLSQDSWYLCSFWYKTTNSSNRVYLYIENFNDVVGAYVNGNSASSGGEFIFLPSDTWTRGYVAFKTLSSNSEPVKLGFGCYKQRSTANISITKPKVEYIENQNTPNYAYPSEWTLSIEDTKGLQGPAGKAGAMLYPQGEWSSTESYSLSIDSEGNIVGKPLVHYKASEHEDGKYYVLKENVSANGATPDKSSKWEEMPKTKYIYTEAVMANWAKFGSDHGAIFYDKYLFSQLGVGNTYYSDDKNNVFDKNGDFYGFVPKLHLDFLNGLANIACLCEPYYTPDYTKEKCTYNSKEDYIMNIGVLPIELSKGFNVKIPYNSNISNFDYPLVILPQLESGNKWLKNGAKVTIMLESGGSDYGSDFGNVSSPVDLKSKFLLVSVDAITNGISAPDFSWTGSNYIIHKGRRAKYIIIAPGNSVTFKASEMGSNVYWRIENEGSITEEKVDIYSNINNEEIYSTSNSVSKSYYNRIQFYGADYSTIVNLSENYYNSEIETRGLMLYAGMEGLCPRNIMFSSGGKMHYKIVANKDISSDFVTDSGPLLGD